MAGLKYKTRWEESPFRKQKIYFCCHQDDFAKYFEEIKKDILERQDCAIWYKENLNQKPDQEFLRELEQMQLVVFPVTKSFLEESNDARETELAYAIEKHIPVLPIMVEHGLEEVFNQICGELQFLQKNQRDKSEIPYEQKLAQFLSNVLVGEEEIKIIRSCFQSSAFLSYRKKDRWLARELMEAIHDIDFCIDMAIWYDEFLVPGENYNDSILEALEKSQLFFLAVTPNLLTDGNYVMTTEYPYAKKLQKTIVPIEMEETNIRDLERKYEGLPPVLEYYGFAYKKELRDHLKKRVETSKTRKKDPEHFYYIGLAFLSGIDVEKDVARGADLIQKAAEAGYLPAMQKLAGIYKQGNGVQRDYKQMLYWEEKWLELTEQRIREAAPEEIFVNEIEDIVEHLAIMTGDYMLLYEREKSKHCFEKMMFLTRDFKDDLTHPYFGRMYLSSCQRLGLWNSDEGNLEIARALYKEVILQCEHMMKSENQDVVIRATVELGKTCRYMGILSERDENKELAEQYYLMSIDIIKKLELNFQTLMELLTIYNYYMQYLIRADRCEEAESYKEECMHLVELQKQEREDDDYYENVCMMYKTFGDMYHREKKYPDSEQCYRIVWKNRYMLWESLETSKQLDKLIEVSECLAVNLEEEEKRRQSRVYKMLSAYLALKQYWQQKTEEEKQHFYNQCGRLAVGMETSTGTKDMRKILREYEWTKRMEWEETGEEEVLEDLASTYFIQILIAWVDTGSLNKQEKMLNQVYETWKKAVNRCSEYRYLLDLLEKDFPRLTHRDFLEFEHSVLGRIYNMEDPSEEEDEFSYRGMEDLEEEREMSDPFGFLKKIFKKRRK